MNVQSASQSGLTLIKVWRKTGMRCHCIVNPDGRWGKSKSPDPVEFLVCPVAVPTLTFGVERSLLNIEVSVAK